MSECIRLRYDGEYYYCGEFDSTYEKTMSNMNYQNCDGCECKVVECHYDEDGNECYMDFEDEDEWEDNSLQIYEIGGE